MVDQSKPQPETARSTRKRDPTVPSASTPAEDPILDLQRQAGNRAVAEMLQGKPAGGPTDPSPALRLRDSLRAGRPAQREMSLDVQRDAKEDAKEDAESKGGGAEPKVERLLRFGSRGPDVAEVQALLGLTADGRFGARTRAAVIAFQRSAGLEPDGIVGPLTRGALRARDRDAAKLAEKLPSSTEKFPGEEKLEGSTEKLPSSTEKFPGEEKLA
jgi:Putative peptidoglycan binding domain